MEEFTTLAPGTMVWIRRNAANAQDRRHLGRIVTICRPIGNPAEPGYTVEVQAERPHLNFLDIVARFIITIAQEQEELY